MTCWPLSLPPGMISWLLPLSRGICSQLQRTSSELDVPGIMLGVNKLQESQGKSFTLGWVCIRERAWAGEPAGGGLNRRRIRKATQLRWPDKSSSTCMRGSAENFLEIQTQKTAQLAWASAFCLVILASLEKKKKWHVRRKISQDNGVSWEIRFKKLKCLNRNNRHFSEHQLHSYYKWHLGSLLQSTHMRKGGHRWSELFKITQQDQDFTWKPILLSIWTKKCESHSVVSDSLLPHGL